MQTFVQYIQTLCVSKFASFVGKVSEPEAGTVSAIAGQLRDNLKASLFKTLDELQSYLQLMQGDEAIIAIINNADADKQEKALNNRLLETIMQQIKFVGRTIHNQSEFSKSVSRQMLSTGSAATEGKIEVDLHRAGVSIKDKTPAAQAAPVVDNELIGLGSLHPDLCSKYASLLNQDGLLGLDAVMDKYIEKLAFPGGAKFQLAGKKRKTCITIEEQYSTRFQLEVTIGQIIISDRDNTPLCVLVLKEPFAIIFQCKIFLDQTKAESPSLLTRQLASLTTSEEQLTFCGLDNINVDNIDYQATCRKAGDEYSKVQEMAIKNIVRRYLTKIQELFIYFFKDPSVCAEREMAADTPEPVPSQADFASLSFSGEALPEASPVGGPPRKLPSPLQNASRFFSPASGSFSATTSTGQERSEAPSAQSTEPGEASLPSFVMYPSAPPMRKQPTETGAELVVGSPTFSS